MSDLLMLHTLVTRVSLFTNYLNVEVRLKSAGYQVAKDALGGALSSEHLTIGGRKWKLRRGKDSNEGDMLLSATCCICSQGATKAFVCAL